MSRKPGSTISKILFYMAISLAVFAMVGFGMTGILSNSNSASVATVGDSEVTTDSYFRNLQNEVNSLSQQFGQTVTIDQAILFGVDQNVLQNLITLAAFEDEAKRLGISVSDERIRDILMTTPGFQGLTGQFDKTLYEDTLSRSGLTTPEYEYLIRQDATQSIVQSAITAGVTLPEAGTLAVFDYIGESRSFNYARLDAGNLSSAVPQASESDLAEFYEAHPDLFTQALTRHITYVSLTPEMVADTLEISETRIEEMYQSRISEYDTPARRFVERIVFGDEAQASDAMARITAGEVTFEDIASERGIAIADTDLGDVSADELSNAAAELLFATYDPGVYGPVASDLGPAIFRLNAAIDAQLIPLDAVREELSREIALSDAIGTIANEADAVIDLIASGATLEEIGNETAMNLASIDLIEGEASGIAAYSSFRDEASVSEVGEDRDIIDLEDGGIFALRIDSISEATLKPMDLVEDELLAAWKADQTQEMVVAAGEKLASGINSSASANMDSYSFAYSLNIEVAESVTRVSNLSDLPPAITEALFALEIGQAASVADDRGAVVIELTAVSPFDPQEITSRVMVQQANASQIELLTQDVAAFFGMGLVSSAEITVNQSRIETLHRQLQ